MKRPVIAVTADSLVESSEYINENFADFAPRDLKEVILKAGGLPVILPFPEETELVEEVAREMVKLFDGLIIPGGFDVSPTFYGEEPERAMGRTSYQRDTYELALFKAAKEAGKSIFGICRGLQLINVALGGTLYQDLAVQNKESFIQHSQVSYGAFPTHHVKIMENSSLYGLFGEQAYVNSRHHQAIKMLAPELMVTARAVDNVIEGVTTADEQVTAVQWHPENMWRNDKKQFQLFAEFICKCQK
ncbi:gamma-glutamyl-gamma-aminobutyrate hydrolase family protein [Lactococcus nasutitermitis]|uniref:Gamma-glutamyl-gamma-aminobutyrate hydrolase family protein n=1 Tax=Lactococcus nasutitermitis TaxID=1652957 RepID=A0ABV9JBD7_9LACT|nr:gamma-glutamyl-gamma-aminobutyrate hydrolase family protein [Lactococcus nasutitermitis]